MLQLNILHLKKEFGNKEVLKDVTFHLNHGEKIGLVGPNGCGKSTLLHIINGQEDHDGGQIYLDKNARIQFMGQDHFAGRLAESDNIEESIYLQMLDIRKEQLDSPEVLSGGERTKINLSKVFSKEANLLLLDEPTNNLDAQGLEVLIYLLGAYEGSAVIVSHDRYFLDRTVDKILELEDGTATLYHGNYTYYREEKVRLKEEQMHRYAEDVKSQKQIEASIRQLRDVSAKAHRNSTKADSSGLKMGVKEKKRAKAKKKDQQIKSNLKRLEKMKKDGEHRPQEEKKVYFRLQEAQSQGKRILEAEGIGKAYDGNQLFSNTSFYMGRGEKIALAGPNGCGKSTLIRILQGEEDVDEGTIWMSPGSMPYVLKQTFWELPQNRTTLAYFTEKFGQLNGLERIMLHNMGLTKVHLEQKIGSLSFGEQMKVKLAEPILEKRDFIILDEPTNHLDLFAREMLEETLHDYEGTLLVVSHDRYFIEKVCNKALVFQDGKIKRMEDLSYIDNI